MKKSEAIPPTRSQEKSQVTAFVYIEGILDKTRGACCEGMGWDGMGWPCLKNTPRGHHDWRFACWGWMAE